MKYQKLLRLYFFLKCFFKDSVVHTKLSKPNESDVSQVNYAYDALRIPY